MQGKNDSETSFIVVNCHIDDIAEQISEFRNPDRGYKHEQYSHIPDLPATELAKKIFDNDYFRAKFTNRMVDTFYDDLQAILLDKDIMKYVLSSVLDTVNQDTSNPR